MMQLQDRPSKGSLVWRDERRREVLFPEALMERKTLRMATFQDQMRLLPPQGLLRLHQMVILKEVRRELKCQLSINISSKGWEPLDSLSSWCKEVWKKALVLSKELFMKRSKICIWSFFGSFIYSRWK